MNQLTYFAGPVCFPSPTEQSGFLIVSVVAAVLLLIGFTNLKLYKMVLIKWFKESTSTFWQRALLLCAGVLLSTVTLGFFTGTTETIGYCKDGVWEGLQVPLIWVAIIVTVFIAMLAFVLALLFFVKCLVALYAKIKSRNN